MKKISFPLGLCLAVSLTIHIVGGVAAYKIIPPQEKKKPMIMEMVANAGDGQGKDSGPGQGKHKGDSEKSGGDGMKDKNKFNSFGQDEISDEIKTCGPKNVYIGVGAAFQQINPGEERSVPVIVFEDGRPFYKIKEVKPNGPLAKAGIKAGDLLDTTVTRVTMMPLGSEISVYAGPKGKTKLYSLKSILICFR